MKKMSLKPDTLLAPVPIALVSCGNFEKANITTIAWTGIINSVPPMLYISVRPERYSYGIIKETQEFVINIPNEKLVFETDYCGTKTGRIEDKFEVAGFTKEKCSEIEAPAIKECDINIECKVKEIKQLGSHHMFISEIVAVNAKESVLDEEGKIDYEKARLLTYQGSNYYVADRKVGKRGICLSL